MKNKCKHEKIIRTKLKGQGNKIWFMCSKCTQLFIEFLDPEIINIVGRK